MLTLSFAQLLVAVCVPACAISATIVVFYRKKMSVLTAKHLEYKEITNQAVMAIGDTIDAKDEYTSGHSKRVAIYAIELGKRMGFSPEELENLYYAALLHDIGKVGLADNILNKAERLSDEEYDIMKRHVDVGGEILGTISCVDDIATGAKYHHERYDGKGYTEGLKGEEIPLIARIICVADAYDAMSTSRPYRDYLSNEYIYEELRKGRATQFDPIIVDHMLDILIATEERID